MGSGEDIWDGGWGDQPPWFPAPPVAGPDIELLDSLDAVLRGIGARHEDILRRRVGLGDVEHQTLQEIGDEYGLTGERIRQIQVKALVRVRARMTRFSRQPERPEAVLHQRLASQLRARRRGERGTYLRMTFPGTNVQMLSELLEPFCSAHAGQIVAWVTESVAAEEEARRASDRRRSASERLDRLLRGAVRTGHAVTAAWPGFEPVRTVGDEGKLLWSSKLGRDVQSESGVEAHVIGVLEAADDVESYCEQPVWIQYPWFGETRRYVPDLAVQLGDGRVIVIEVKPRTLWVDGVNLAKWNAAMRWCSQRGWGFAVVDGRGHPGDLLGLSDSSDLALLEKLTEHGPADFAQLRMAWFGSGRSWTRLVSAALRYGFAFRRAPFRVQRARRSPWLTALQAHAGHWDGLPPNSRSSDAAL